MIDSKPEIINIFSVIRLFYTLSGFNLIREYITPYLRSKITTALLKLSRAVAFTIKREGNVPLKRLSAFAYGDLQNNQSVSCINFFIII